jgi:Fe-S-cluster containining protein
MVEDNIQIKKCKRCGTCCKKGGPSFHLEDKVLIEKGVILSRHLYTIREGELAYDNVMGSLQPVSTDTIKIKGQRDSWTCIFFEAQGNKCKIYENRPVECRVLKCWNTADIEKLYSENRLTRKDLISEVEGLWDLVEDHQKRCSYEKVRKFVKTLKGEKRNDAMEGLIEMIGYDTQLRTLVREKGGVDPEMLDFLFGRPLTKTIENYGLKIKRDLSIRNNTPNT